MDVIWKKLFFKPVFQFRLLLCKVSWVENAAGIRKPVRRCSVCKSCLFLILSEVIDHFTASTSRSGAVFACMRMEVSAS